MADPHDDAAVARTSLECASVAALTTYPRLAAQPYLTSVAVRAGEGDSAVVLMGPGAPAAQHLLTRPFATVTVALTGCQRVTLHGGVQRLPGTDDVGRLAFRVEAGAVRLGGDPMPVAIAEYANARADLFARDARAVVSHLRRPHHAEQLAACLRALGHYAQFADLVALDPTGMTLLTVGLDGVTPVHLDFPAPITKLADLPPDLHALLTCHCGDCSTPTSATDFH